MEDIVFELIDDHVDGADMYTYSGSIWMIFTDQKKWIIELTKEGTLWYNYYFFKNLFKYVSMDDIEYQDYITKWVEKTIQNGVRHNLYRIDRPTIIVEKTIQNGVKHAISEINQDILWVEKTIQNGMKHTQWPLEERKNKVEKTIQNGVKHTQGSVFDNPTTVKETIQNGVKQTNKSLRVDGSCVIEDVIRTTYPEYNDMSERVEKVVKETELHKGTRPASTEHTIQNGVKKTYPDKIPHEYDWSNQFTEEIDDIIQNGVKHTEYGDWEDGDERLDDIMQNGIKKTISGHPDKKEFVEKVVLQHGVKETWGYDKQPQIRIDNVIENGIRPTSEM